MKCGEEEYSWRVRKDYLEFRTSDKIFKVDGVDNMGTVELIGWIVKAE